MQKVFSYLYCLHSKRLSVTSAALLLLMRVAAAAAAAAAAATQEALNLG
jgi:hypothetical protein